MSSFLDLTPTVRIIIDNPLLHKTYPRDGFVNGLIDTGYEGFVAVPSSVFEELALNKLRNERRRVALPDGTAVNGKGCYASIRIPHISTRIDGFVESFGGLDEIMIGVEGLRRTRLLLDYCTGLVKMERCLSE